MLTFALYNFENRWRECFISLVDKIIPHEKILETATQVDFSKEEIIDKPFDKVCAKRLFVEKVEEFDYNTPKNIIKATLGNSIDNKDSVDFIECIPILLSNDKIAYFYPTHDVIDVTEFSNGDIGYPIKKEANKLRKGDKILVRQSAKDIIKEKADELIKRDSNEGIRNKAIQWFALLRKASLNKSVERVWEALCSERKEISLAQVKYWLSGETIMPRDKGVLLAIGMFALKNSVEKEICETFLSNIDMIYEAGRQVQGYHQKAGRWLTRELKNKSTELKTILNDKKGQGTIEDIGEVAIYTIEDVLDKEKIKRGRINKIEELY